MYTSMNQEEPTGKGSQLAHRAAAAGGLQPWSTCRSTVLPCHNQHRSIGNETRGRQTTIKRGCRLLRRYRAIRGDVERSGKSRCSRRKSLHDSLWTRRIPECHYVPARGRDEDNETLRHSCLVHAEVDLGHGCTSTADPRSYHAYLAQRPDEMEVEAIRQVIELVREIGTRACILSLIFGQALPMIEQAKLDGASTVETLSTTSA